MVAPHMPNRRKRVFVDVTPTLVNPDGSRTALGAVRYELEIEPSVGQYYPFHTMISSRVPLDQTGWGGLEFSALVTDAEIPQPKPIDAVSAYPKLETNAQYGKWTNAQGHPIDAEGRPIFPDGVR